MTPAPRRQPSVTRRDALAAGIACWSALALGGLAPAAPATAGKPEWVDQRQVGPFAFRSTTPLAEAELAEADLAELERELRRVLAISPLRRGIEVLVLRDADEHRRTVAALHPTAPYRRALFVRRGDVATVLVYRHAELSIDLRHEGTHGLLHGDLPNLPLWLDEGLAEYFEAPGAERAAGAHHYDRVVWDFRLGRQKSLKDLESKRDLAQLSPADYRQAWAWTHFLLHGPGAATAALWAFLTDLRRGQAAGDLSERLYASLPDAEERRVAHFKHWPSVIRASRQPSVASLP
ncbi:MAG: hypothetical protein ACRCT8_15645 [Lacipirellulaceae bacterium]